MARTRIDIGDILVGFCGGFFGRDSYDDKRVEAVGTDWVVCRNDHGEPEFASSKGKSIHDALSKYLLQNNKS